MRENMTLIISINEVKPYSIEALNKACRIEADVIMKTVVQRVQRILMMQF
jgi:hypothetical protein